MNREKLMDAKNAIGLGIVFLVWGAALAWEYWYNRNRENTNLRARLILEDTPSKREELLAEEGIVEDA